MKILVINASPVKNGATAEIIRVFSERAARLGDVKTVCVDDYDIAPCRGCRSCHATARCIISDGAQRLVADIDDADFVCIAAPSYWAGLPGQFKQFIDRCTPLCDTHTPHAELRKGKRGCAIALRTGPSAGECERIIADIAHFYGHLHIAMLGGLALCGVENASDVPARADEITAFCDSLML